MGAVICYRFYYLDVVGPTMDTIRYPLINKIILHIRLAFQLFAGQAILLLEHTKIKIVLLVVANVGLAKLVILLSCCNYILIVLLKTPLI